MSFSSEEESDSVLQETIADLLEKGESKGEEQKKKNIKKLSKVTATKKRKIVEVIEKMSRGGASEDEEADVVTEKQCKKQPAQKKAKGIVVKNLVCYFTFSLHIFL